MLIKTVTLNQVFTRSSKLGLKHQFQRSKTVLILVCDSCDKEFQRDLSKMQRLRLHDDYNHVCSDCDQKKFAQKRSVQKRKQWSLSADSDRVLNSIFSCSDKK
jgi:hypothetical protein